MISALGGERKAVQNPFIRYAEEAGWTYIPPDEAIRLRRGGSGLILNDIFIKQIIRLNPGMVDSNRAEDLIRRIERIKARIEGNKDAWEYLTGLKTIFVPDEKREHNVRLLARDWEANTYHVSDELTFDNGTRRIRLDIVFFINGFPVIVVETKSAKKIEGIAEALDQIRRYHREGPELMALMQLHTLTHLIQFYYGPTWNITGKTLFNWKEEAAAGDFETIVKTFIHPQRIIRVLLDFIMFTYKGDELSKVILRPHQMRAVDRVIRRSRESGKQRGLVWHTQGSGKTYTMIIVAKKLIEDPIYENPTVLMIIDRNELEGQLQDNLKSCGIEYFELAESKKYLRDLLKKDQRGLIVSMIHKFDDIPANINKRDNVFVLVDEAHRTTGGDLGNYLMGALPNATYIGFTGTPIDRTAYGKGTFKVFGTDDPKGYLDKYSIAESIKDGTTVPLNYTLARNDLLVDRDTLEREFLDLAEIEGVSDIEEVNKVLDRAVTLKTMLKEPERVEKVAKYVTDHFKKVIEPMGYKAFLVAADREACALYKEALDKHLPPKYSRVVFSPIKEPEHVAKYNISESEEKRVRKSFRKPEELPKILIVTEKLLTGFDAPILYCMYLDKPMRDHVLLQAIARVNRPYEDEYGRSKPAGFVLDFVGIFDKLEKALAFDSKDVEGVIQDIELLKERFAEMMVQALPEYLQIYKGPTDDKSTENLLEHFRDEGPRHKFYGFFKELSELYEILSPDKFLRDFLKDYQKVVEMYQMLRAAYERGVIVDKEFLRKTEKLVKKHTHSGKIEDPIDIYEINEETMEKIAASDKPPGVKVFNLLKSIQREIEKRGPLAPYLLSIGEKAELIAKMFEQRQIDTMEALKRLEELIEEINQAESERAEKSLAPEAFAVYWLLKRGGIPDPEEASTSMAKAFELHPYWATSESHEREVRKELYKSLTKAGVKTGELTELAQQVMNVIRKAQR